MGRADFGKICVDMGWPYAADGTQLSTGVGWGHITSTDLVRWTSRGPALAPPFVDIKANRTAQDAGFYGVNDAVVGYFTGSAAIIDGVPRLLHPRALLRRARSETPVGPV